MTTTKRYDPKLSAENDRIARDAVTTHCNTILSRYDWADEWLLRDNPDTYGVDLITKNRCIGVEVEIKKYAFFQIALREGVNILERKARHAEDKWGFEEIYFWLVDDDLTRAIVCDANDVAKISPIVTMVDSRNGGSTGMHKRSEGIRCIPIDWFNVVTLITSPQLTMRL